MKKDKSVLAENDQAFRSMTKKIGLAMIFHLIIFNALNVLVGCLDTFLWMFFIDSAAYVISEILYMVAYLCGFLLPALILHKMIDRRGSTLPIMKQSMPATTPFLVIGTVTINFAAAYFNQYLISILVPLPDSSMLYSTSVMTEWYEFLFLFFSVAVVPAFCEEILFRGVILSNLIPFGRTTAIWGSAILFGLMHGNILQFFYTSLLGIILGYVYVRTKSIWICMLIHFVNNGIGVLQESMGSMPDQDLATRLNGGLELLVMVLGVISILVLLFLRAKQEKPEENGSFGVIFAPSLTYETHHVTKKRKLYLFFSPTMIIYFVLAGVSTALTVIYLLLSWVAV
ncbi:MAG: CPBP family intramembrane metalloprotease [Clostridia bacterium]|nr:CPBP family intramembrane metalloprotease [Clostridia bacterium]